MHGRVVITGLALAACAPRAAAPAPARVDGCAALRALDLPHVAITGARVVPADEYLTAEVPAHPPYCRVEGVARPTRDSAIRFEVDIPAGDAWNGRYRQIGNGGFAGMIPEDDLVAGVARGDAVAGTDDGHASVRAIDASWALGHPERVIDFGYRAVKQTHDAALAILRAYTGRAPRARYFTGCSDGGREALMEAQRYPGDFDGIVAGAPVNHATAVLAAFAWNERALEATPASYIPAAKLPAIERAAQAACGDAGGVIEDPLACRFDPAVLRCAAATDDDRCLTDPQLAALAAIYAGPHDPRTGARILAGLEPGAEAEPGAWDAWIVGAAAGAPGRAAQRRFASTFYRYMVFGDPAYDLRRLDFDRDVQAAAAKLGPILDAGDPDLGAFARRGGKLLVYHGWNDPVVPPRDSIAYHDAVRAKLGDPSSFYRLFLVPGMLHCDGGRGPASLPVQGAIEAWVEHGRAPDELVAPGARTWLLHPYPRPVAVR